MPTVSRRMHFVISGVKKRVLKGDLRFYVNPDIKRKKARIIQT
jgi:hypothetical protein